MSEENVEVVRRAFGGVRPGDLDAMVENVDADAVMRPETWETVMGAWHMDATR